MKNKEPRVFFILVVEKSNNMVRLIVRSKNMEGLDNREKKIVKDSIFERQAELVVRFPKSQYDVIVGGMKASMNVLKSAYPEFHGWGEATQEELAM